MEGSKGASRLSLCMIVRNEAENLPGCLTSIMGSADETIVIDTGSSDGTPDLARSAGARVHQHAWNDDFAAARNFGLNLATGDWVLCLDADERLQTGDGPCLRALLEDPGAEGWFLAIWNHFSDDPHALAPHLSLRLFRNRPAHRFVGRVHETVDPEALRSNPAAFRPAPDVRIHHYGYLVDDPRLPAKITRNLNLAEREAAERPDDPLVRFNLGTEYFRLGRRAEALTEYAEARQRAAAAMAFLPALVRNSVICHIQLGQLSGAKREIERGLIDLPDFGELHYLMALIRQMEGDYAGALAAIADCLRLGDSPMHYGTLAGTAGHRAHTMAAHCHRLLNQPEREAEELLLALASGGPPDLRDRLAECLAGLDGEAWDRLRERFPEVLTNPPGSGGPLDS